MAKALLGHVRGPDQRMAAELRRLRQRVGDLETQLARLKQERGAAPPGSQAVPPCPRSTTAAAAPSSPAPPADTCDASDTGELPVPHATPSTQAR